MFQCFASSLSLVKTSCFSASLPSLCHSSRFSTLQAWHHHWRMKHEGSKTKILSLLLFQFDLLSRLYCIAPHAQPLRSSWLAYAIYVVHVRTSSMYNFWHRTTYVLDGLASGKGRGEISLLLLLILSNVCPYYCYVLLVGDAQQFFWSADKRTTNFMIVQLNFWQVYPYLSLY